MSYEIARDEIPLDKDNLIPFLNWNYINIGKLKKFEDAIKEKNKTYSMNKIEIEQISGLFSDSAADEELRGYVNNLIPDSFILHATIRLTAPYFSKDDDEFYLIQNPCLKGKVFKVPMVRGSGWKGAIASAGKLLLNENLKWFESYIRVFGTGSQEYRDLIYYLEKDKDIKEKLVKYALFELGLKLKKEQIETINNDPKKFLEELSTNFTKENIKNISYLQVHKGRAIFYPTYFDKLSLEIINPHDRRKRAGTNPIHYEVVPKKSKGIFQIIYIPFDGVLMKDDKLKEQAEKDMEFLRQAVEKATDIGIGAKTKLGWGRFSIENKKALSNKSDLSIPEGWK